MTLMCEPLNELCVDALREVGNIGAGHAVTSLSSLLDYRVNMAVPRVGLVPLSEFMRLTGGPETMAACVYLCVDGDAPGHVAFILPEASALRLADDLLGQPSGTSTTLGEMESSALMEVGNILTSSFLVAIGDLTGLNMLSTPPALAIDMTAAILSSIASLFAPLGNHALTIVTRIGDETGQKAGVIEGFFLYVPNPGSLQTLLHALQMEF